MSLVSHLSPSSLLAMAKKGSWDLMFLNPKCNNTEHVRKPWLGSQCQTWVQATQPLSELRFPHLQNGIMSDALFTVLLWAIEEVMCPLSAQLTVNKDGPPVHQQWMDERTVIYPYNGILFSHGKKWSIDTYRNWMSLESNRLSKKHEWLVIPVVSNSLRPYGR